MDVQPLASESPHARRRLSRAERAAQLRAQAAHLDQLAKAEDRKRDTRRKILIGGVVLAALLEEPESPLATGVRALLHARVTREPDRQALADVL